MIGLTVFAFLWAIVATALLCVAEYKYRKHIAPQIRSLESETKKILEQVAIARLYRKQNL